MIYFNKSVIQKLCNKYYLCIHKLFKLDTQDFTDFNHINDYILEKFNIQAFQHRLFHRLSILSFKMLNFESSPKILHNVILENFLELSSFEMNLLHVPDCKKVLRNRVITIFDADIISKLKTFSYFFNMFFNCVNLDIFNLPLNNFMSYIRQNTNIIFTSLTNTFSYFNLSKSNYSWIKSS